MASPKVHTIEASERSRARTLMLAALGVVYGDIGTSPLYAVRQSLAAFGEVNETSILGTLSLIAWRCSLWSRSNT